MNINQSLLLVVALFAVSASPVIGDVTQANDAGKAFADSLNNSTVGGIAGSVDPSSVPNYQGTNVPGSEQYGQGSNIEANAQAASVNDPTALFINSSRNSRPVFSVDRNTDPLFKRQEEITDLANGLTETGYQGCVSLPVGTADTTVTTTDSCHANRVLNYETCEKTLTVDVQAHSTCTPGAMVSRVKAVSRFWREPRDYVYIETYCHSSGNARIRIWKPNTYGSDSCGKKLRDDISFNLPMKNSARKNDINYLHVYWRRRGSKGAYGCTTLMVDLIKSQCVGDRCSFTFFGQGFYHPRSNPQNQPNGSQFEHDFVETAVNAVKHRRVVDSITDNWDDQCVAMEDVQ